jgi:hypothetical protein
MQPSFYLFLIILRFQQQTDNKKIIGCVLATQFKNNTNSRMKTSTMVEQQKDS